MSDIQSALPGAVHEGAVNVEEAGPRGMVTLRGDLSLTSVKNAATGIAGVDFPGQGEANCVGEKGICWMSPDELLVLCPYSEAETAVAKMTKTMSRSHHLVANVSDARALFFVQALLQCGGVVLSGAPNYARLCLGQVPQRTFGPLGCVWKDHDRGFQPFGSVNCHYPNAIARCIQLPLDFKVVRFHPDKKPG